MSRSGVGAVRAGVQVEGAGGDAGGGVAGDLGSLGGVFGQVAGNGQVADRAGAAQGDDPDVDFGSPADLPAAGLGRVRGSAAGDGPGGPADGVLEVGDRKGRGRGDDAAMVGGVVAVQAQQGVEVDGAARPDHDQRRAAAAAGPAPLAARTAPPAPATHRHRDPGRRAHRQRQCHRLTSPSTGTAPVPFTPRRPRQAGVTAPEQSSAGSASHHPQTVTNLRSFGATTALCSPVVRASSQSYTDFFSNPRS
jgi:hypothetical protein